MPRSAQCSSPAPPADGQRNPGRKGATHHVGLRNRPVVEAEEADQPLQEPPAAEVREVGGAAQDLQERRASMGH